MFGYFSVHGTYVQVRQLMRRIDQTTDIMIPFHGLQEEQNRSTQNSLVTPIAGQKENDPHDSKQQQYIARREERGIQRGKAHQQHQTS